jgi:ABC-type multidrug transport system fused ATPase/permease subunit
LIDVELSLNRGGFYGFIGQSGAGKTTLANLLLGLIDPTAGAVRVDEIPLPLLSRTSWQKSFGYVPQDPFILDGTVRENITFGQPASDDEIWRALRLARLRDVVERLDGKLDARVGENGRQLSGGQVQRLAIARALLRAPDVLFLDEATSALDTLTEAELLGTLSELRGQTTIIMITHRMHALRDCDNIFVLENGRLIAKGTYDELEKNSRQFCELATIDVPALQGG